MTEPQTPIVDALAELGLDTETPAVPEAPVDDFPSLEEVRTQFKRSVKELLTVPPGRLPGLIKDIQRLRLMMILITEVESGKPSEDTYRELVLTSRMLQKDPPPAGGTTPGDQTSEAEETADRLEAELDRANIGPRQAADLLKILERVGTPLGGSDIPDNYEPPEPDDVG